MCKIKIIITNNFIVLKICILEILIQKYICELYTHTLNQLKRRKKSKETETPHSHRPVPCHLPPSPPSPTRIRSPEVVQASPSGPLFDSSQKRENQALPLLCTRVIARFSSFIVAIFVFHKVCRARILLNFRI